MKFSKKVFCLFISVLMLILLTVPSYVGFAVDDSRTQFSDHTYERIDTGMTWKQAKEYCESKGGYLATVTSLSEQLALQELVSKGTMKTYWLGGTDEAQEGEWKWVTGEEWSFWSNTITFDNAAGIEHYLQMQRVNRNPSSNLPFAWNDANNENFIAGEEDYFTTEQIGFICEYGTSEIIDDGSVEFNGHTYKRIEESMTWQEAKIYCENEGGYLASITSQAEQNLVKCLVQNGSKAQYWLGGTDEGSVGDWRWVSGEDFTFFAETVTFETTDNGEYYLQMQRYNPYKDNSCGKWNNAKNDNTIANELEYYNLSNIGFIYESGTSPVPVENNRPMPIVYIIGRTGIYTADGQPTIVENTNFITDVVTGGVDLLMKALLLNKWDEYCDYLYNEISGRYADYRLNSEGNVDNGSHASWSWNQNFIPLVQKDIFTYKYEYDARLDPCQIADDLNNYIEAIKRTSGYDKINLVSRCLGCNIASAYLQEYGWDSVNTNVLYASAAKGYDFVGEMFAGKFAFDSAAIARYADDTFMSDTGDELVTEIIKASIELADESGLLPVGTAVAESIFERIYQDIVPRLLIATYGTSPGYWAMVNDENYEAAKSFIFGDEAGSTYATLIGKLDNYHYNVQNKLEDTLVSMKNSGVKINVICKYGFQVSPFIESSDQVGDNRIEVEKQSFGATASDINKTFLPHYIWMAERNGTAKYISPDNQIDGSTALFPDYTWYVKNYEHNPFHNCFNALLEEMCYSEEQMTVDSNPAWPQYMYYNNNGTCEPLTVENSGGAEYYTKYTTNIFSAVIRFMKSLFALVFRNV